MDDVRFSRRVLLTRLALGAGLMTALSLGGCGGGSSDDNGGGGGGAPTLATRARVTALHDMTVRGSLLAGFQSLPVATARNGWIGGDATAPAPPVFADSGGGTTGGAELSGVPMLGAFLRNVAATRPAARAARIGAQQQQLAAGVSRRAAEDPGAPAPPPPDDIPPPPGVFPTEPIEPTVYFDYYLGLWVKIEYLTGGATYRLYSDEALTEAAGTIETDEPTDWESYPLVWRSQYRFLAGYLAGAHGQSESVTNRDGSGSQTYENAYADGGSDEGRSVWTARGDYTWTSRSEFAEGAGWTEGSGSFRADGGGGTRWETSDGYRGDYTYNADGSGRARITGPDPGLPVTITWDAYGNTTIVYADGTNERIPGWGYYGGGYYGGGGTTGAGGGTPEPVLVGG